MKHHIKLLFLLFFSARPIDITSLNQVLDYLPDKRTLVVFDIDNTLLMPPTDLGSDQWFMHLVQEKMSAGIDPISAIDYWLPLYFHIQFNIDLVATEASIDQTINMIAQQCEHCICLTSRSIGLAQRTILQLARQNLFFSFAQQQSHLFAVTFPCLYQDGTLFCGNNIKAAVLFAFLDYVGYLPEIIIMVDDKQKHLDLIEIAANRRNIPCICLRYAGCDSRVHTFNKEKTAQELQEFLEKYPFDDVAQNNKITKHV